MKQAEKHHFSWVSVRTMHGSRYCCGWTKIVRPRSHPLVQRRSSNGRITPYAEKLIFPYSISLCVSLPRTVAAAVTALRARPQAPAASLRHKAPLGFIVAGSALHVLCHVGWHGRQQFLDIEIKLAHGIVVAVAHREITAALHRGGLLGDEHGVAPVNAP